MIQVLIKGIRRGTASPWTVAGVWLLNLALALPAAIVVQQTLAREMRGSMVERDLRDGVDMEWLGQFGGEAEGVSSTFSASLIRGGAFFGNWESVLQGRVLETFPGMVALALVWGFLWLLITGGLIHRFAGVEEVTQRGFFAHGGLYLGRFVRLALVSAPLYWLVFRFLGWMSNRIEASTRDATEEWAVLVPTLGATFLTAVLLAVVHLTFRFAKIATVAEGRKSTLVAVTRGFGFVFFHPHRVFPLLIAYTAMHALIVFVYHWIGPGVGQSSWTAVVIAFLVSQLVLALKAWLTVSRLASETWLFVETIQPKNLRASVSTPVTPAEVPTAGS